MKLTYLNVPIDSVMAWSWKLNVVWGMRIYLSFSVCMTHFHSLWPVLMRALFHRAQLACFFFRLRRNNSNHKRRASDWRLYDEIVSKRWVHVSYRVQGRDTALEVFEGGEGGKHTNWCASQWIFFAISFFVTISMCHFLKTPPRFGHQSCQFFRPTGIEEVLVFRIPVLQSTLLKSNFGALLGSIQN